MNDVAGKKVDVAQVEEIGLSEEEPATLFVNNLCRDLTKEGVMSLFGCYGEISSIVFVPLSHQSGVAQKMTKCKITFKTFKEAISAQKSLHNAFPFYMRIFIKDNKDMKSAMRNLTPYEDDLFNIDAEEEWTCDEAQRFETIAETDCIDNEAVDDIGGEGGKPEDPGDPSGVPDPQMMELDDLVPSSANESGSGKMQKGVTVGASGDKRHRVTTSSEQVMVASETVKIAKMSSSIEDGSRTDEIKSDDAGVPGAHRDMLDGAGVPGAHKDTLDSAGVPGAHTDMLDGAGVPGAHRDMLAVKNIVNKFQSGLGNVDSHPREDGKYDANRPRDSNATLESSIDSKGQVDRNLQDGKECAHALIDGGHLDRQDYEKEPPEQMESIQDPKYGMESLPVIDSIATKTVPRPPAPTPPIPAFRLEDRTAVFIHPDSFARFPSEFHVLPVGSLASKEEIRQSLDGIGREDIQIIQPRPSSSVLVRYAGSLYRANVEHEQEGQVRVRLVDEGFTVVVAEDCVYQVPTIPLWSRPGLATTVSLAIPQGQEWAEEDTKRFFSLYSEAEDMRTVVVPAEENCESVHQKVHLLVERVDSADVFQLVRRNMAHLTLFDKQIETEMDISENNMMSQASADRRTVVVDSLNSSEETHDQNVRAIEGPANIGHDEADVVKPRLEKVERRSKAVQTGYNWEDPSDFNQEWRRRSREESAEELVCYSDAYLDQEDIPEPDQEIGLAHHQSLYTTLPAQKKMFVKDMVTPKIKLGDECLLMEFGEYINEVILIPLHDLDFNRLELAMLETGLGEGLTRLPEVGEVLAAPRRFYNRTKFIRVEVMKVYRKEGKVTVRGIDHMYGKTERIERLRPLSLDGARLPAYTAKAALSKVPRLLRSATFKFVSTELEKLLETPIMVFLEKEDENPPLVDLFVQVGEEEVRVNELLCADLAEAGLQFNTADQKRTTIERPFDDQRNRQKTKKAPNGMAREDIIKQFIADNEELFHKLEVGGEENVLVLHCESPELVSVVPDSELEPLLGLANLCHKLATSNVFITDKPTLGKVYLARVEGEPDWHRVLLLDHGSNGQVRVFSLDFGFFARVAAAALKPYIPREEVKYSVLLCEVENWEEADAEEAWGDSAKARSSGAVLKALTYDCTGGENKEGKGSAVDLVKYQNRRRREIQRVLPNMKVRLVKVLRRCGSVYTIRI